MITCQADQCATRLEERGLLHVAEDVGRRHGVPLPLLLGRTRYASVAKARRELYVLLRHHALSYPEIGALLGRDHTTILHGVRDYETAPNRFRVAS